MIGAHMNNFKLDIVEIKKPDDIEGRRYHQDLAEKFCRINALRSSDKDRISGYTCQ